MPKKISGGTFSALNKGPSSEPVAIGIQELK
jgi:hypothetical protein